MWPGAAIYKPAGNLPFVGECRSDDAAKRIHLNFAPVTAVWIRYGVLQPGSYRLYRLCTSKVNGGPSWSRLVKS